MDNNKKIENKNINNKEKTTAKNKISNNKKNTSSKKIKANGTAKSNNATKKNSNYKKKTNQKNNNIKKDNLDNTYISIEREKINKKYSDEKKNLISENTKSNNIDVDLELKKIEEKLLNDNFFVKKEKIYHKETIEDKSIDNNKSVSLLDVKNDEIEEIADANEVIDNLIENKEVLHKPNNIKKKKVKYKPLLILLIKIIFVLIFYYLIFGLIFGAMRMNDTNMGPSISGGELLIYYRLEKEYNVGDVVIIKHDGKTYVSRIVALENMTVDINEEKEVLIDDYPENYIPFYPTDKENSKIVFPYKVEKNKYFVLNDHRLNTDDSRLFGSISSDEIIGKVIAKLKIRDM